MRALRLGPDRIPEIAKIAPAFFEEGKLPGKFVPEVFIKFWEQMYGLGLAQMFGAEIEGVLVGGLGGMVYPDPCDGERVASEMFWFILPQFRGGGLALFNDFEKWAVERDAKRITMIHLQGLAPGILKKLYLRKGYQEVEVHYVKSLS